MAPLTVPSAHQLVKNYASGEIPLTVLDGIDLDSALADFDPTLPIWTRIE